MEDPHNQNGRNEEALVFGFVHNYLGLFLRFLTIKQSIFAMFYTLELFCHLQCSPYLNFTNDQVYFFLKVAKLWAILS